MVYSDVAAAVQAAVADPACPRRMRLISPYLPISPHISSYLPRPARAG